MSKAHERYFRRLSRRAKIPAKEVSKVWDDFTTKLIDEGFKQNDPKFIQILNSRVRVELEIESNNICLDKFKKFLK